MRIHGDQGAGVAQIVHQRGDLALQPLHHLKCHIEKVARAAGGVEHGGFAQSRVKVAHKLQRVVGLAIFCQALNGSLHVTPILTEGFNDGGCHEPLHIGARRVMRAQLVALPLVEGAFQQGAEDRRFDLFPVCFSGFDQKAELQIIQRQGLGLFEKATVEAFEVLHQHLGKPAGVHGVPQALERRFGVFRMAAQLAQEFSEAATRDQVHIFGEHREQAAHEKTGNGFAVMALAFEAVAQFGEVGGNVARDIGGSERGIKAVGIGPDHAQHVTDVTLAQVFQVDTIAVAIRVLVVALPLFREVRVKFDDMAHVNNHQKGWPAVFPGNGAGVVVGLVARLEHGVVPGGCAPHTVADAFLCARGDAPGQIDCAVLLLVHALLGFEYEMPATVDVDEAGGAFLRVGKCHRPFEPVMVVAVVIGGRVRPVDAQQIGQFDHEELVIGMFAAPGLLPPADELVNLMCVRHTVSVAGLESVFNQKLCEAGEIMALRSVSGEYMKPIKPDTL